MIVQGAIDLDDKSKLAAVLDAVIAATKTGGLDHAIEVAVGDNRKLKRKAA